MFPTLLLALSLTTSVPDSVVMDSRLTFEQAVAGTSAPDSVIRTLTLVDVEYYSFDDRLHRGQVVIHKELAEDIEYIFKETKRLKFPIHSVIPIKFDKPGDGTSMDTLNNTYGFHYRPKATFKTRQLSAHSYGRAIDINPFQNPAILRNGKTVPSKGRYHPNVRGTLTATSSLTRLFRRMGWRWGGSWTSLKDYMHFEKP